jgi:hypothetical protein
MKQLLFLLLFPCFALAQYPNNGNQKITLGEQTTADGLVYRGVASIDTVTATSKITRANKQDTSAFLLLDTTTNLLWHYKTASNGWIQAGGSTFDTTTLNLTTRFAAKQNNITLTTTGTSGASTFSPSTATLNIPNYTITNPVTGTGTTNYLPKFTGTSTIGNSLIYDNGTNVGIGTASPLYKLDVYGGSASTYIGLRATGAGNETTLALSNVNGDAYVGLTGGAGSIIVGTAAGDLNINNRTGGKINLSTTSANSQVTIDASGNVGIGTGSPTAVLHLKAGTATASTAPLKFTSGTNLTTAEAGAMEFNGTNLLFSPSTTRHTVNHGLTGSATLDFPSTTTLLSADLTVTVTGAADGDVVSLGVPNASVNANTCYTAWVSAANTVTVRFNNYSSGTVNPASGSFKVFVTK